MFRDTILKVVERIIMDCPPVKAIDTTEIFEIIDWRISLLGKTAADDLIKQELDIIKAEIEREIK